MDIKIKRTYETHAPDDGYRVLVDRLWPRGIKKEKARLDTWMKEVAPSAALRKWFDHDPDKWSLFVSKYDHELKTSSHFKELLLLLKKHKIVTLLYSAKDEQHNHARALKQILESAEMPR